MSALHEPGWFWIAFGEDWGSEGVAVLHAEDAMDALRKADAFEPAGTVTSHATPMPEEALPAERFRGRFLDRREADEARADIAERRR